jgi:hypothetical protein
MVTGRRAFKGDDVGDVMAAVIRAEPEWTGVPARLRRVIESCLEKDPRKRLRDIGDAWRLLGDTDAAIAHTPVGTRVVLPWAIAALAVGAVIALAVWASTRPTAPPVTAQFTVGPSPASTFRYLFTGASVAPDGRSVAFSGYEGQQGTNLLYLRTIDNLVARPLAGTANADSPFWSPDGSSIAFFADGKLKRLDLATGSPLVLADAPGGAGGGTWNRSNTLLFAAKGGLYRVPASGGTVSPVLSEGSSDHGRTLAFRSFCLTATGSSTWLCHPEPTRRTAESG